MTRKSIPEIKNKVAAVAAELKGEYYAEQDIVMKVTTSQGDYYYDLEAMVTKDSHKNTITYHPIKDVVLDNIKTTCLITKVEVRSPAADKTFGFENWMNCNLGSNVPVNGSGTVTIQFKDGFFTMR